ncbi:unnamed protein product, partial [Discosporangium mesarthrocarpum]
EEVSSTDQGVGEVGGDRESQEDDVWEEEGTGYLEVSGDRQGEDEQGVYSNSDELWEETPGDGTKDNCAVGGLGEGASIWNPENAFEEKLSKIQLILQRQSWKKWRRIDRQVMYSLRLNQATEKVTFLKRQRKLRKVVVGILLRRTTQQGEAADHTDATAVAFQVLKQTLRQ